MAAALFLIFLLVASGGAAVLGDDAARLPHLQLRGTAESAREHASDAPLMGYLNSTRGCGRFAALVARTSNAREVFREYAVAGGLTLFCPDDLAVAAFEPRFGNLSADNQLAVLLHHGAPAPYGREQIVAFEQVAVRTLATDVATNKSLSLALTVGDDGDKVWVWPYPPSSGGTYGAPARVTEAISSDVFPLAVYVVDAVLLPSHLRHLLHGAAVCKPSPCGGGGYLGWLHCSIKVWQGLCWVVSCMVCLLAGIFVTGYYCNLRLIRAGPIKSRACAKLKNGPYLIRKLS